MHYRVEPGLCAVGCPNPASPVLVTANYKLTFDRLRGELGGIDAWILVLDTRGINVWCAAGKGTFGTDELVRRVEAVRLGEVVSHRDLVLPQLGAVGVSAHEVRARSGWRVRYGPVRAADLREYLRSPATLPPEARRVRFPLGDRLAVVPVELVQGLKYLGAAAVLLLLLSGIGPGGYAIDRIADVGLRSVALLVAAYVAGVVVTPALLPWIPGRAFSVKGAWVGIVLAGGALGWTLAAGGFGSARTPEIFDNAAEAGAWLLLVPAVSSFLAMNFTGASTYTSLSGVRREMRAAVPVQVGAAALALALWGVGRFL